MANDFIRMPDDTSATGKKMRTNTRTGMGPSGTDTVHESYVINIDETSGTSARVLTTAPGASDAGVVVRPVLPTRTQRTLYSQSFASVTSEVLLNLSQVLNFATATTGTTWTVTSGKVFRVQSIYLTNRLSAATHNWVRVNLRAVASGTVAATSPIIATVSLPTVPIGTAAANYGQSIVQAFPDGLELPSGASFGLSHIGAAATGANDVVVVGYEY